MIEAIVFMCLVLPYMAIGHITKQLEDSITNSFFKELVYVLRYPFSMFDEE